MSSKKPEKSPPPKNHFEKARTELESILKSYDLSEEDYNSLIEDIRRRQGKEKGREFDRLDDLLEEE